MSRSAGNVSTSSEYVNVTVTVLSPTGLKGKKETFNKGVISELSLCVPIELSLGDVY